MSTEKPPEVDEIGLLCGEEQIGKYTVKGWTLRQFQALLPILLEALKALQAMEISWEDLGTDQTKTLRAVQAVLEVLTPHAARVLAISLGISEDEAADMDLADASVLLLKIIAHNVEHLKNLPARLTATVQALSPGGS